MSIRWDELPEYVPPPLPPATNRKRVFVVTDALFALGSVALAVVATTGAPSAQGWTRWFLPAAWITQLVAGWWLCDGLARSIHLLRGQWPTRRRVVRAWAAPAVWVLVAELTVLRLEPTEVVDVRPAIAAIGFWIAAWRPFALFRRTFQSLTRRNHDAPVLVFGLLLIVTWSITWWLVHADPENGGGVAWGGAVAAIATVPMSVSIGRFLFHAIAYRRLAIQTYEEHRYVRSLGLNPFHAGTYLELVMAKQERERRRGASAEVAELRAENLRAEHAAARLPDGRDTPARAPGSSPDDGQARRRRRSRERPTESAPEPGRRPTTADDPTGATDDHGVDRADDSPRTEPRSGADEAEGPEFTDRPHGGATVDGATTVEGEAADDDAAIRPMAATEDGTVDADVATDGRSDGAPPRVTSIEAVRYLALVALVATATGYAWITLNALALREPIVAGQLSAVDVARLDRARDWTTGVLVAAVPVQAWWVVAARVWVGRAGHRLEVRRTGALATATSVLAVVLALARLADASVGLQAALLVVVGAGSWLCILSASPVAAWGGHSQLMVRLWATGLVVATIVHALTLAVGPVAPTSSVQAIAFVSVVLGLVLANTAIVAGVFTVEIEDDLKSSSVLARWYGERLDAEIGSESTASQR